MADLPEDRVSSEEPPFSHVGVDYLGPFEVKHGRSLVKRYGVIVTCLYTLKLLHHWTQILALMHYKALLQDEDRSKSYGQTMALTLSTESAS